MNKEVKELYRFLGNHLQGLSKKKFESFLGVKGVEISNCKKSHDLTYDHWVCFIIIGVPGLKFRFKCHFTSKDSRTLAEVILGNSSSDMDAQSCHTVLTEFSNIVGIAFKSAIIDIFQDVFKLDENNNMQPILPEKRPSYDLGGLDDDFGTEGYYNIWSLSYKDVSIICSNKFLIIEDELAQSYGDKEEFFKRMSLLSIQDKGELDYF
jgi:hypothetical protein